MRVIAVVASALTIAACAKAPESIAPAYVSEVSYQGYSCAQLGEESARLNAALAQASVRQNNARSGDAVGIILIGLPVASMSGDNIAPEIARLKGEQEAVHKASMRRSCVKPAPAPAVAAGAAKKPVS